MNRLAKQCLVGGATVLALALGATSALTRPASPSNATSMRVSVVRANWPGCEPNCPEWIAAQGKIDEATPAKFKKVLDQIGKRRLPVLIDSLGGSGEDAYAVGRMIRAKGLDVAVSQSDLVQCPAKARDAKSKAGTSKGDKTKADPACETTSAKGVALGRPRTLMSKCASACAFILAAGKRRAAAVGTFVGVHQVKTFETRIRSLRTYRTLGSERVLVSEKRISAKTVAVKTTDSTYRKMKRYFAEMGVTEAIMPLVMSAPHTNIHVLTNDEFKTTKLVTDRITGEQLVKISDPPAVKSDAQTTAQPQPASAPAKAPLATTAKR